MREVGAPLAIEDVEVATPTSREVLVDVVATGLCHSDLRFLEGAFSHDLPALLGHEAAGIVRAVGDEVEAVQVGDHVVMSISVSCGACALCTAGKRHLCVDKDATRRSPGQPARLSAGGEVVNQFLDLSGFAEQMLVHESAIVSIDYGIDLVHAAVLGCGVATGLGAIFNTAEVRRGERVAVIGCGGVGLSAVQGARIAGAAQVIAIDPLPEKLDLASKLGATDTVLSHDPELVGKVVEMADGLGVDHVIEAVGSTTTIEQGFAMTRRGGTTTVVGLVPVGSKVAIPTDELFYERRLQGSVMGSNDFVIDVPRYLNLYLDGVLDLDGMVTERMPLERINRGFDIMRAGKSARVVVEFG